MLLGYIPRPVKTFLHIAALLLASTSAFAGGQHIIPDYATAQRNFFWTKLYVNGGRDLYCNVRFIVGQRLTVEHVYAADGRIKSRWLRTLLKYDFLEHTHLTVYVAAAFRCSMRRNVKLNVA
jgi:hypothetical protein